MGTKGIARTPWLIGPQPDDEEDYDDDDDDDDDCADDDDDENHDNCNCKKHLVALSL